MGEFFDTVTRVVLSGNITLQQLRENSKKLKEVLLNSGVDKVDIEGLPKEEILIEISQLEAARLKLSFNQIANLIKRETQDVSGGSFADGSLRVRTVGERRLVETFSEHYIVTEEEIKEIINMFAVNPDAFDLDEFFDMEGMESELIKMDTPPIIEKV